MQHVRLWVTATTALFVLAGEAAAMDGRNAVNQCINRGNGCVYSVGSSGDIIILVDDKIIYCESATSECVVTRKKVGKRVGMGPLGPDAQPLTRFPGN